MDELKIYEIKDFILDYVNNNDPKEALLEAAFNASRKEISIVAFKRYASEINNDGYMKIRHISGSRSVATLTPSGRQFIRKGGYVADMFKNIKEAKLKAEYEFKQREKINLEIQELKTRLENYKFIKTGTIIALILSGLSFLYLIIKEFILKIFN